MRMMLGVVLMVAGLSACTPTPSVPPMTGGPQQCDAAGASSLIGSHMGAVTFPAGKEVRIVCTTCPTTRDYRPDRLNVRFDEATGIIRSVDCG